jgi:hypothetical protein
MTDNNNFKDEFYFLNKESFPEDFLPVYNKANIIPKRIFQSAVILPFHIPIRSGTCITMILEDNLAFTLVFGKVNTTNKFNAGLVRSEAFELPISKTVAELNLITNIDKFHESEGQEDFDLMSFLFDLCLEKLNFFITSYLIITKDTSIHQVSIKMLEVASMYRFIKPDTWNYEIGLFLLHENIPYQKTEISFEEAQEVIWYANVINQKWNPFILPEELMLNSKRNFATGFYREAIIYSQTAFETFARTLLSEFYKQDGKSEIELNQTFDNFGFMGVLKREFHTRIGGKWDITDDSTELGVWYRDCYMRRNRIIHGGYNPNHNDARLAIGSADNVIGKILDLTSLKKKTYPSVFEYIKKKKNNAP